MTKAAQAREQRVSFQLLFEHHPLPMCVCDLKTLRVRMVNAAAVVFYGYSKGEFQKLRITDLGLPEDAPRLLATVAQVRPGRRHVGQWRHRTKDGRVIDVEVIARALVLAGRRVALVVAREITARQQAEQVVCEREQRLAELEALHRISIAMRGASSLGEALPVLLNETLAVLATDSGSIFVYDSASGYLTAVVDRGWFRDLRRSSYRPGEGIAGTVFATGQPYHSVEFSRDPLMHTLAADQIPARWGGACVPIRTPTEVVGVLFVSVPLPREITPEQVTLLQSMAEMAGTAVHRMRLHEAALRRVEHLQALATVDRTISASLDLGLTLNVLLDQVTTQLQLDAAGVLLVQPGRSGLEHALSRGFRTSVYAGLSLRMGKGLAGQAALERRTLAVTDPQEAPEVTRRGLMEPEGFVTHFAVPLVAKGQVKGVLEGFHRRPFRPDREWMDLLEAMAEQAAIAIENAQLFQELQRSNTDLVLAYDATIEGWSNALDLRDKETEGHTQRVTALTVRLARAMGMNDEELVHVRRGALLHDIGKMGIPDSILLKPGPLTDDERAIMEKHPVYALQLLSPIAYLRPALPIPYAHHERWDGTGYPRGLRGEGIPLEARIFAVVDVYDALTSDRPYRPAWSEEQALQYVREQAGTHFDPVVVQQFLALIDLDARGAGERQPHLRAG